MDNKRLALFNQTMRVLITLGFSAAFLLVSILFIFFFVGALEAGTLLTVGVIDTGLDLTDPRFSKVLCASGHKDLTGEGISDRIGHGTHVAGLIMEYAKKKTGYCMVIIKYYKKNGVGSTNGMRFSQGIEIAASMHLPIVNISGGGGDFSEREYLAIRNAPSTHFIVAAGNEGKNTDYIQNYYYPASYGLSNITSVGALAQDGATRFEGSNYGSNIKAWEIGENVYSTAIGGRTKAMSGTSISTGIHTGKVVAEILSK